MTEINALTLVGYIFLFMLILVSVTIISTQNSQSQIEKAAVAYEISSIINNMADVDEGWVQTQLENEYDIDIKCTGDGCLLSLKEKNQAKPIELPLLVLFVEGGPLKNTREICVEKTLDKIEIKKTCVA